MDIDEINRRNMERIGWRMYGPLQQFLSPARCSGSGESDTSRSLTASLHHTAQTAQSDGDAYAEKQLFR